MVAVSLMRFALAALVVVAVAASAASVWEDEEPSAVASLTEGRSLIKRNYNSCSSFDRGTIGRLNRVCDDCYNYYRDNDVAVSCRRNCFQNSVFFQCLDDLFLPRTRNQFRTAMQRVGK